MIDRALGFTPTESYYFQLYPVNLILLQEPAPSNQSKFRFSIYKGQQKFDENKIPTDANFIQTNGSYVMPFRGSQLNFYLPNFNKNRKVLFTLKLNEREGNEQYDLGGIEIDPANYITQFKENNKNRFEQKIEISEQYALEFQMYIEKSRFALEKIVKSFRTQRTMKSPVRERKSPMQSPLQNRQSERSESYKTSSKKIQTPIQEPTQQVEPQQQVVPKKQQENSIHQPGRKNLQTHQQRRDMRSEKSETIVSPMVRTKQITRTSARKQSTIRASQRLQHGAEESASPGPSGIVPNKEEGWTSHIQLIIFTILGVLMIYWTMHPTKKF